MLVYRFFFHEHVRKYELNIVWNGLILILIFVLLYCISRINSQNVNLLTLIFINVNLYVNFYLVRGK